MGAENLVLPDMKNLLDINVNWRKSLPYILDFFLEVNLGIVFSARSESYSFLYFAGLFLILFGIIQLIRKIKTFHITKTKLIVKRPLMPFKFVEVDFEFDKIKNIEFKKVIRVGPYLKIVGGANGKDGGFSLALEKNVIDVFENTLKNQGVTITRKDI